MEKLYNKYIVAKTNGQPVDPNAQYFVLRIDTDSAAGIALLVYANEIEKDNPIFARQLRAWIEEFGQQHLTINDN